MGFILLIVLLVLLFGGLPRWNYSRNWGYAPNNFRAVSNERATAQRLG